MSTYLFSVFDLSKLSVFDFQVYYLISGFLGIIESGVLEGSIHIGSVGLGKYELEIFLSKKKTDYVGLHPKGLQSASARHSHDMS